MDALVSIVIPCYNAESFIFETITSVLSQDYSNLEIIIVDDGSTDKSASIIQKFNDQRIRYIYQNNAGVSNARNKGLLNAKGQFIVFFDADDLMSESFLSSRLTELKKTDLNFIGGKVLHQTGNEVLKQDFYFPKKDTFQSDILMFKSEINTCPSNMMLVTSFLKEHKIHFNEKLSSTADRYFLLECGSTGTGYYSEKVAPLIYRISENSMSHLLSEKLVLDNEKYYEELKINNLIPDELKMEFNKKMLRLLSGANYKLKKFRKSLIFGSKYLAVAAKIITSIYYII